MNENFKTFATFLGSGNRASKIWFVGIEEGGAPITQDNLNEQIEKIKNGSPYFENAIDKTQVWDIIAEIMWECIKNQNSSSLKKYRLRMFSERYAYFFLTELFPLPRPNTSNWPDSYEKIFGYRKKDSCQYLSDVREYRYPLIYKLWDLVQPEITICFGSSYQNEFIHLFNLGHSKFKSYFDDRLLFFPEKKVLITPFFKRYIINEKEIAKIKDFVQPLVNHIISEL